MTGGCPVKHDGSIPASLEHAARHAQTPQSDQQIPLSTHRIISSIPRAADNSQNDSSHQADGEGKNWVYPSEQQFYNAMRRKGWEGVDESTMPLVVRIHNAVNERGWSHVRRWEKELYDNDNPRLVRFLGRPKDMSPNAFINTYLFWYSPPFDRHDWFIDRGDGEPARRYVIDFYSGGDGNSSEKGISSTMFGQQRKNLPPRPPSMYLDVRPALDSTEALLDRFKMFFIDSFPGIYGAMKTRKTMTTPTANNKHVDTKTSATGTK
eukprot:CAMPEP_0194241106 /NCGR_PEP_ID=MMETSP0158-20130606/7070_1 /TAXON_ID=33649 /ORGANISM="Thalassionema nitzschioides, Strain L26-B" /LENGTH=264 /DNA_ID=CAMNT_0038975937 /DNA_START=80 /DNA_END=874 /DNA_ORIENTATION=+